MVGSYAVMKDSLLRFGVAMEPGLVEQLDAIAASRGCNRSELIRDLVRAEVSRSAVADRTPAFAALTLVYNHHVRELSERLTMLQHDLGESVRSTMHVHLDREHCLEVIVMRGRSDELKEATARMVGTRGVIHGGAEFIAETTLATSGSGRRVHHHGHEHAHDHSHAPAKAGSRKTPAKPRTRSKRAKSER